MVPIFIEKSTPLSVVFSDHCPLPYRDVKCCDTAFRRTTSSVTSSAVAICRRNFIHVNAKREAIGESDGSRPLVFEHLQHHFVLHLVKLFQRRLERGAIFKGSTHHHLFQAIGGVPH